MNRVYNLSKGTQLTIFQEFKPVTFISRALGVFSLKIANVSGNQVFATSRGAMIYSIVLIGLTIIHLIYLPQMTVASNDFVNSYNGSINNNNSTKTHHRPLAHLDLIIRMLNGIVMSLMGIFSKINTMLYIRSDLPKAFTTLNMIDGVLRLKSEQHRKNMNAIWILVGLSILVGLPGQIYSSIFIYMGKSYFVGIYVFFNNYNNFSAVSAETQFMAICHLLKSRFDIINLKLLDVQKFYDLEKRLYPNPNGEMVVKRTPGILLLSDIKGISDLKKTLKTQKNTRFTTEDIFLSKISITETIQTLRTSHQRLCDVLDQANSMFQLQLLFSISGCFLNLLFNMYSFFSGGAWRGYKDPDIVTSNNTKSVLLSHPLINLSWGIYYAVRIIAMAVIASKTTKAAKESLIHILHIRGSSVDTTVKEELIFFHDHVTSRKIGFSAVGFFDLDISLISSAVTSGSTYLVMMVQLHD